MSKETGEFICALNGGRGELDAWLECNDEAECRFAIKPIVEQRDELLEALKYMASMDNCVTADDSVAAMLRHGEASDRAKAIILDGANLAIAPISISGLKWFVLISESYMKIGCQRHTHEEWKSFDSESIAKMHDAASAFWKQWKSPLLAMCKAHRAESLAYRKANPEKFVEAA